jgi:hypothetical protein
MSQEPKYVSLDKVVKEHIARQKVDPKAGLFNILQWVIDPSFVSEIFAAPPPFFEPIFTEDIDCEIIEPKQLPSTENQTNP